MAWSPQLFTSGRIALLGATLLFLAASTAEVAAQGTSGVINYTGELGPVSARRPLCLCIYRDPSLASRLGCLIFSANDVAYQVNLGQADYYLIAFLDIHINEQLDADEPYEIFRDRAEPPGDAVPGASVRTDIDFIFGDENLPGETTPTPSSTPSATPSPSLMPSSPPTSTVTATSTASPTPSPSPTSTVMATSTASPSPGPTTETPACPSANGSECVGACAGDCDGSGVVEVNELVRIIGSALQAPVSRPCGDANRNGTVEIDEIVAAVARSLTNCLTL